MYVDSTWYGIVENAVVSFVRRMIGLCARNVEKLLAMCIHMTGREAAYSGHGKRGQSDVWGMDL